MLIDELDQIVHRNVYRTDGAVIDVSAVAERVLAELPRKLAGQVSRSQVRDRIVIIATRKAARNKALSRAG